MFGIKHTFASESRLAGSAGRLSSTVRVSTAITPTGIPPKRARPHTTVCAHGNKISSHDPRSKNPLSHSCALPVILQRILIHYKDYVDLSRLIQLCYQQYAFMQMEFIRVMREKDSNSMQKQAIQELSTPLPVTTTFVSSYFHFLKIHICF